MLSNAEPVDGNGLPSGHGPLQAATVTVTRLYKERNVLALEVPGLDR